MTFAGLPDAKDRANVVAFLNSKGSNLPLPKVEAKPAEAAPAAGATPTAGEGPAANASGAPSAANTAAPSMAGANAGGAAK